MALQRPSLSVLFAACLAWPALGQADAVYDVGSTTTFASIPQALNAASADHVGPFSVTVRVRAFSGVYPPLDLNSGTFALNPQPGAGLVVEAMPGTLPVISGSGNSGLRVSGLAHVELSGFRIQGNYSDALLIEAAPYLSADKLEILGGAVSAATLRDSPDARLTNSQLEPGSGVAVLLERSMRAFLQYNRVGQASQPNYGHVIQDSHQAWLDHNHSGGADQAYNVFSSSHVTLSANVAIRRDGARGLVLDSSPYAWILKNLLVGQEIGVEALASTACAMEQNTVWEHSTTALYTRSNCADLRLRNNLWQGFLAIFLDAATEASLDSDYQGFLGSGSFGVGSVNYPTLASWQLVTRDANSVYGDASFVNSSGSSPEDFKLGAGTPMSAHGQNLSSRFDTDYFYNPLPPPPAPWDPGFHVALAPQATPSPTSVPLSPTHSPTISPTPSLTPSPTVTPPATGTPLPSSTDTRTSTITPTLTATPFPFQKDRVITYPNPYRPKLGGQHIAFEPAESASIKVLDLNGQLVLDLPGGSIQAGQGHALWDGRDKEGRLVAPGLYFCIVRTSRSTHFTRFTVLY